MSLMRSMAMFLGMAALAGCVATKPLASAGAAREQLLVSSAIDDATSKLQLSEPAGERIFVRSDAPNSFEGQYLIGRIRARLLEQGYAIADQPQEADLILEVSVAAMALDQHGRNLGVPAFTAGPLASVPAVSLYQSDNSRAVMKVAFVIYSAKTGLLASPTQTLTGRADESRRTLGGAITVATSGQAP